MEDFVRHIQSDDGDRELHWLFEFVIKPQLKELLDALNTCSNLLIYNSSEKSSTERDIDTSVKLPFSSSKSEVLKGVLMRNGSYITGLSIAIKESQFNRVLHKLTLKSPLKLEQLENTARSIDNAISLIERSFSALTEKCSSEHDELIKIFDTLLREVRLARTNVQLPTDPSLVFPNNVADPDSFDPPLPDKVSLDLYVNQSEVCLDLKYLHMVEETPWCLVDDQGKSYVDYVRDEMKRRNDNSVANSGSLPSLNLEEIEKRFSRSIPSQNINIVSKTLSHISLKPKQTPLDFITKCVTYNGKVVVVKKKIDVSSPDPVLVSVSTKLTTIESLISNIVENAQKVIVSVS
ncbi:Piso0_000763 [Millerozyma farinosa CBS 7064]|uniref:Piso0_000763 protein n=1 Tax=Pichia sorbitophila (strain ATCC MYA-4447 / BCRC 22081 / CBS 7064 / NBRC 10061 / NRRL Y-12695) TaxID=559304 RepID=G8YRG0_PICSO|nr:Piso0_000763 [Millerozyma farinosa CBS 7064]